MPVNGISPNGEVHLNNNGSEVVVVLDYVWSSEEWGALESNGLFPLRQLDFNSVLAWDSDGETNIQAL